MLAMAEQRHEELGRRVDHVHHGSTTSQQRSKA
jgi:hypothetical protein